jgi:hypothetical protein
MDIPRVLHDNCPCNHSLDTKGTGRIRGRHRRSHGGYSGLHELFRRVRPCHSYNEFDFAPLLFNVSLRKPKLQKPPTTLKVKPFETIVTTECIRCGERLVVCCRDLSPILIK